MQLIYNVMLVSAVLQSVSVVHISTLFQILFPNRSLLCLVTQSCPTLVQVTCDSMDCSPPGSSVHGDSPGKNTGVYCHALLQGNLPNPGSEPRSPTLQVDSLPSEPPGKPKNPRVYRLSVLQAFFPTHESNWGLLHWSRII